MVQIRSNRLAVHESSDGDWLNSTSMPLIICGSGTAQVNRAWGTLERLGDVGCLDRVQSALLYDINNDTTRRVNTKSRRMSSSIGTSVFTPRFIPTDTGFHRDPYGYLNYSGTLFQEQEKVVAELGERADQLGTPPQMIIHFMGFGSHSLLGAILHGRLKSRFPHARSLVILDIPRDPTLHDQMRDVWDEMMKLLPDERFLVTDDRIGDPHITDHQLACAIATIEASSQAGAQSGPTITDVISGLTKGNLGSWLGMSSISAYRLPVKKVWSLIPPFKRTRLIRGKSEELALLGIRAAKDTLQKRFDLAHYTEQENRARSMIFCSVPLKLDEIPELESQVQNALANEGFFKENPYASFSLASANMTSTNTSLQYTSNRPTRHGIISKMISNTVGNVWKSLKMLSSIIVGRDGHAPYLHCVRLYPLTSVRNPKMDIESLRSVLYGERPVVQMELDAEEELPTNGHKDEKMFEEVFGR